MRKLIITGCVAGSAAIILGQFGFFDAFLMFLLAGVIPGTSYSIPSNIMYSLVLGGISLVIIYFIGVSVLDFFHKQAAKISSVQPKPTSDHKKRLPKRRYSQI
jgi:hypothetical protein